MDFTPSAIKVYAVLMAIVCLFTLFALVIQKHKDATQAQDPTAIQRFYSGEEVSLGEIGGSNNVTEEAKVWCARHQVREEEIDAKVRELVRGYFNAKVKIDLTMPESPAPVQ